MKKVFITTIPLQGKFDLDVVTYVPKDFRLTKNGETSFPIIPIIAEHLEDMGEIEIIAIRMNNDDTARNYLKFLEEVESLGLEKECVKTLDMPEKQSPKTQVAMMLKLIDKIPNHSVIHCCVTYGTKVVSTVVTYAMMYITKILSDVDVRGMYYGEIKRNDGMLVESNLYDVTSLLAVGEIIEQLRGIEVNNIKGALKSMFEDVLGDIE